MLIREKQIFYINSAYRLTGTNSSFSYKLDLQSREYDKAVVLQISIPKSYYLIQNGQNTFILDEITEQATITIPAGSYTRTALKTTMRDLLTNNSPRNWTYIVTTPASIEAETGLFTFTVSSNSGNQTSFIFTSYLYEVLGFNANSTNTFVANTLVSTNVINLQRESTLFLHSDICANNGDNVLQEVYSVDDPDYGHITFTCPDVESYSKPITAKNNNIYNFNLTDENSQEMDLNGQNIVFTLMLYKQENVYKMLRQILQIGLLESVRDK